MALEKNWDLIIIGQGLSSLALLDELCEYKGAQKLKILCLSNELMLPSCSLNSTATISCAGIEKGVSTFGDQLVESFEIFKDKFNKKEFSGVSRATQYVFSKNSDDLKFSHRYGSAKKLPLKGDLWGRKFESFIAYPELFLEGLKQKINSSLDISWHKGLVTSLSFDRDWKLDTLEGDSFCASKMFLGLGAGQKIYGALLGGKRQEKDYGKAVVAGSYLSFSDINWGNEALIFSQGKMNLIYRPKGNELLFGGSINSREFLLGGKESLEASYEKFKHWLSKDYELPEFSRGEERVGMRLKGVKRQPIWGELDKGLFSAHAFYKNGYTLAFLAAKEVAPRVLGM